MDRINHPTATGAQQFTEGNIAQGVPATVVSAAWLNGVQEELLAVIEAAGLTPDADNLGQLLQAIATMGQDIGAATTAEAGIVELADQTESIAGGSGSLGQTPLGSTQHFEARLAGYTANGLHKLFSGDLDTLLRNGRHVYSTTTSSNFPDGQIGWGVVRVSMHAVNDNFGLQVAEGLNAQPGYRWIRQRLDGVWQPWTPVGINAKTGTVEAVGTRSTTGTWTLTGLTIGRPVYLTFTTSSDINTAVQFNIVSGAANASQLASYYSQMGAYNVGDTARANVAIIIPTSTTVVVEVHSITASMTVLAYQ